MEEIPHGDKTIKVGIIFFANNLPNLKMAWQKGVVRIVTNRSRGIRNDDNPIPFNKFEEIPSKIKELLEKNNIVLMNHNRKSKALEVVKI